MRDLAIQELAQINGGYYVESMVNGAQDGLRWASLIALGSLFAGQAVAYNPFYALGAGAAIGGAIGLAKPASADLDSMLARASTNATVETPAIEATVTV